jgi:glycosyltransferase involved in cell wall biosynthesis
MNDKPLVSVIIPSYNYGRFISFAFDSLRAQTYTNWECVVVDDGSTDDTAQVVSRYTNVDKRFKFLRQENARQAAAKNNGLRHSSGQYVQFLDADDLIEREKFNRQVEFLETHPDVDIVYGDVRYFRTENHNERLHSWGGTDSPWMPKTSGRGREVLLALARHNIMVINSPLIRRSVVDAVGPFDVTLPPAEDWDYWLRCAALGASFQFADLPGTLALVRWHSESSSQDRRRMYAAMVAIGEKVKSLTEDGEILLLNKERTISDRETLALETISHGPLTDYVGQMFRTGLLAQRWKSRLKWITCACAAPFLSRQHLRALVTSSLTASKSSRHADGTSAPAAGPR